MKFHQEESGWARSKKGVSLLVLAAVLNGSLLAGTVVADPLEGQSIQIGEKFTLHSRILNEDRPYWVYLPPSYRDATYAPKRYPVLYLLDGDLHFASTSGIVQYMSGAEYWENLQIPELIVVAIPNTDRTRDFTPSHSLKSLDGREYPNFFASSGGADAFLKFLKEELLPRIDSQYRTLPYRVLVGHSLGGTFAVNAFLDQPSLFQAWLAIDPAIAWDDQFLLRKAKRVLPQTTDLHACFYICMANHSDLKAWYDPDKFDLPLEEFAALIKTNTSPQLRSKFQRFDSEDHPSVPLMGLYEGLLFTFDGYEPSEGAATENPITLDEHFAEVSKRLGFKILPPEQYVDNAGYMLTAGNDIGKAIALFKLNATNYPLSFHAYDSLAHAYAIKGDKESAIKNYKKSLELNPNDQSAIGQLKKFERQ